MEAEELSRFYERLSLTKEDGPIGRVGLPLQERGLKSVAMCLFRKMIANKEINREAFRSAIPKIWRTTKEFEIEAIGSNSFVFRFSCVGDRNRILEGDDYLGKFVRVKVVVDIAKPLMRGLRVSMGDPEEFSVVVLNSWMRAIGPPVRSRGGNNFRGGSKEAGCEKENLNPNVTVNRGVGAEGFSKQCPPIAECEQRKDNIFHASDGDFVSRKVASVLNPVDVVVGRNLNSSIPYSSIFSDDVFSGVVCQKSTQELESKVELSFKENLVEDGFQTSLSVPSPVSKKG
ncbi:hypothetical protein ACOSQ2_027531 [Xanthoceras sorbifolium]